MSSYDSSFAPPPAPLIPSDLKTSSFQTSRPKVINSTVTQSASAAPVTINAASGLITTAALTTAVDATETFTVNNSFVSPGNVIIATATGNTGSQGMPSVSIDNQASGSFVLNITNVGAAVFNGRIVVSFLVV